MQGEQKGGGGRSGNRKRAFLCLESVLTKNSMQENRIVNHKNNMLICYRFT